MVRPSSLEHARARTPRTTWPRHVRRSTTWRVGWLWCGGLQALPSWGPAAWPHTAW